MTVSERIPFSGLLLPLPKGYTYSCDRRTAWSCCSFPVRTGVHDITSSRICRSLTGRRQATPTAERTAISGTVSRALSK